jgi:hypothetical protein
MSFRCEKNLKTYNELNIFEMLIYNEQAGAELCQAQFKLALLG